VPKFYLRGFCVPGSEHIWVGDLKTRKSYAANIADVGVENDFYSDAGGVHEDDLEVRLSKIESAAAPKLRGFLRGETGIDPDLGRFIAWLAARTTWLRRVVQETFPDFLRANTELLRQESGAENEVFDFEHISTGHRELLPLSNALVRLQDSTWRMHVPQDYHLHAIRMQAWLLREKHFPKLEWTKLTAPADCYFITSDRPVSWDIAGDSVADHPAAFGHQSVELTVPLCSGHALVAVHDRSTLAKKQLITVSAINERTRTNAERFIYGAREEDVEVYLEQLRVQQIN